MAETAIIKIQMRFDTVANFTSANPVLLVGEIAFVTNGKYFVIGDGVSTFTQLSPSDPLLTSQDRFRNEAYIQQNMLNPLNVALTTAINAEITNRTIGDASLQSQITSEIALRISGDASLQTQITTEQGERIAADNNLSTAVTDLLASFALFQTDVIAAVAAEEAARIAADGVLQANIDAVDLFTAGLVLEDAALQDAINAEITAREDADAALQTNIDGKANTSHTHAATDIVSGTLDVARLGSNAADSSLVLHGDNTWRSKVELTNFWEYFNDMVTNTAAQTVETITSSVATVGVFASQPTAFGIAQMQTNAGATAHTCFRLSNTNLIINKATASCYVARVFIDSLSTVVETFNLKCGFNDGANASSVGSNSAMIRYTNGVNGGRWQCANRASNVETTADSGITVAINTWYILKILMTTTAVEYYIDGVLVQTIATNIPTTGVGQITGIQKTVGTTNRNFRIDYYYLKIPTGR